MRSIIPMITIALACAASAQDNPYVVQGSIGNVEKVKVQSEGPASLELDGWVGERFILLRKSPSVRKYGYQSFGLPYAEWVGKILMVTKVEKGAFPRVEFKTEDGTMVTAVAYSNSVNNIAPLRDLDYARKRWLGKSLWLRQPEILTFDEEAEKYGSVRLGRTAHVRVKNVVAGTFDHEPVRFILVADNGREGFVDVQLSGTNVSDGLRGTSPFSDYFTEVDPRTKFKAWSPRVWKAIAEEKVFIGMSAAQARTSWGEPHDINRTTIKGQRTEQWVYGTGTYLYVRDGIVTAVQN